MSRSLALFALIAGLALAFIHPPVGSTSLPVPVSGFPVPVFSAPAPQHSSCVACHTSHAALEPLVKPFPALPAEGEG